MHVYVLAEEGVKARMPVWGLEEEETEEGKQIGACQGAEWMWEWVAVK